MLLGLGLLALLCSVWLPFAMLLNSVLPIRWGRRIGRASIMAAFRFYLGFLTLCCACRFELGDLDRLRNTGPLILVANHPSLLDVVMIASRLPEAVCVMKATLLDNPLFGSAARLAGYIRNDGPVQMVLNARREVRQGAHLVLFPEGTRTSSFPVGACTDSAGLIAKAAAVPIQTALIECSTPYLGKAWPLLRRPTLPLHFRIHLGERFEPPQDVKAFTARLQRYFQEQLESGGEPSGAGRP